MNLCNKSYEIWFCYSLKSQCPSRSVENLWHRPRFAKLPVGSTECWIKVMFDPSFVTLMYKLYWFRLSAGNKEIRMKVKNQMEIPIFILLYFQNSSLWITLDSSVLLAVGAKVNHDCDPDGLYPCLYYESSCNRTTDAVTVCKCKEGYSLSANGTCEKRK